VVGIDTRERVGAMYAAYVGSDFKTVAELIHPDIDWMIYSPMTIFPFAGHRRGRVQVLEAMAGIAESYKLDSYVTEWIIVDGDSAAVMSDAGFVQRATKRNLRFRLADFLRFKDGRLIEFREFANTFDVVEQALGRELAL